MLLDNSGTLLPDFRSFGQSGLISFAIDANANTRNLSS